MAEATILNLFESKIEPLDPPSPKTPPYNQTWSGLDDQLRRYGHYVWKNRDLKLFTEGALTTCCGRLFQWRTTRWLKKYFRTCSLARDINSFMLWPLSVLTGRQLEESCFAPPTSIEIEFSYILISLLYVLQQWRNG